MFYRRANPRKFNVYSTDFRIAIAHKGLKVNKLDSRGRAVGPAVWGTWEEVTGYAQDGNYYMDMTPAQISAFIRRKIFNKQVPIPEKLW